MEFVKLFVILLLVAMIMHVTESRKSPKEWKKCKGSKTTSKADCDCPPPSPLNGKVSGDSGAEYLQNNAVTYSCNEGYFLEGETTPTCQSDGTWGNVNSTTCRAVCSILPQASTTPYMLASLSPFDRSIDCYWVIEAKEGYTIDFSIKEMLIKNIEYDATGDILCADYVEVFDGRNNAGTTLGKYCGSTVPAAILSTGRYLLVHFHSDYKLGDQWFAAEYKEVDK